MIVSATSVRASSASKSQKTAAVPDDDAARRRQRKQVVGKYELGRILAIGDFDCRTRLCTHVVTGAPYVARVYDKAVLAEAEWMWCRVKQSIHVQRTLPKHENVVEMTECFETRSSLYILMHLFPSVNVAELMTPDTTASAAPAPAAAAANTQPALYRNGAAEGLAKATGGLGAARRSVFMSAHVQSHGSPAVTALGAWAGPRGGHGAGGGVASGSSKRKMALSNVRRIFERVVRGTMHLHQHGVVHLGLAPDHVLVNVERGQVKISNLISCFFCPRGRRITELRGTKHTVAPEVLRKEPYDPYLADAWALGIILYYMLNDGRYPHDGANTLQHILYNHVRPCKNALPAEAKDLVARLLQPQPSDRLTVEAILLHPFMDFSTALHRSGTVRRSVVAPDRSATPPAAGRGGGDDAGPLEEENASSVDHLGPPPADTAVSAARVLPGSGSSNGGGGAERLPEFVRPSFRHGIHSSSVSSLRAGRGGALSRSTSSRQLASSPDTSTAPGAVAADATAAAARQDGAIEWSSDSEEMAHSDSLSDSFSSGSGSSDSFLGEVSRNDDYDGVASSQSDSAAYGSSSSSPGTRRRAASRSGSGSSSSSSSSSSSGGTACGSPVVIIALSADASHSQRSRLDSSGNSTAVPPTSTAPRELHRRRSSIRRTSDGKSTHRSGSLVRHASMSGSPPPPLSRSKSTVGRGSFFRFSSHGSQSNSCSTRRSSVVGISRDASGDDDRSTSTGRGRAADGDSDGRLNRLPSVSFFDGDAPPLPPPPPPPTTTLSQQRYLPRAQSMRKGPQVVLVRNSWDQATGTYRLQLSSHLSLEEQAAVVIQYCFRDYRQRKQFREQTQQLLTRAAALFAGRLPSHAGAGLLQSSMSVSANTTAASGAAAGTSVGAAVAAVTSGRRPRSPPPSGLATTTSRTTISPLLPSLMATSMSSSTPPSVALAHPSQASARQPIVRLATEPRPTTSFRAAVPNAAGGRGAGARNPLTGSAEGQRSPLGSRQNLRPGGSAGAAAAAAAANVPALPAPLLSFRKASFMAPATGVRDKPPTPWTSWRAVNGGGNNNNNSASASASGEAGSYGDAVKRFGLAVAAVSPAPPSSLAAVSTAYPTGSVGAAAAAAAANRAAALPSSSNLLALRRQFSFAGAMVPVGGGSGGAAGGWDSECPVCRQPPRPAVRIRSTPYRHTPYEYKAGEFTAVSTEQDDR